MIKFVYFTLIAIFITSCASLFAPRKQTLTFKSSTPGSTMLIDSIQHSSDSSTTFEVKQGCQIVTNSKEGFLEEKKILISDQKRKMHLANAFVLTPIALTIGKIISPNSSFGSYIIHEEGGTIIVGGALLTWLESNSARNKKHEDKIYSFGKLTPIPKKDSSQAYLEINKTTMNIAKGDFTINYFSSWSNYSDNITTELANNLEKLEGRNYSINDELNDLLNQYEFKDSTKRFLGNNFKSLNLDCEIVKGNLTYVEGAFIRSEYKVKWSLKDIYQKGLITKTITVPSSPIVIDPYKTTEEEFKKEMEGLFINSLEKSLISFLSEDDVKSVMKNTNVDDFTNDASKWDDISIKVDSVSHNIASAVEAVVTVKTEGGHGSGCVISNDGYIVTNFHVISGQDSVVIINEDGKEINGIVIRSNPRSDLALIKVDFKYNTALKISTKSSLLGLDVYAIGTPEDVKFGQSVSKGIVSGKRTFNSLDYIQTDVSVNSGNSGGALITEEGLIIGVVNAKLMGMGIEGIGFAIPASNIFKELKITLK